MKKHIIVIGGGMAGTAAAYHLQKKGYTITILEKNDRLGGRIHSIEMEGVPVELGAGFLTNMYQQVLSFVSETGLSKQLFSQKSYAGVFKNNTFYSPVALFFSLSLYSKMLFSNLLISLVLMWFRIDIRNPGTITDFDTSSVADMFQTHNKKQILTDILQPILNGYCFWTPEQTSQTMLMVLAKFLLKGGRYRLQKGLQQIPETAARGCHLLLNCHVTRVTKEKKGYYSVTFKNQGKIQTMQADGVVCATTATTVSQILPELHHKQKTFFSSIKYAATVVVAQVYRQTDAGRDSAMAIPRTEKKAIATITVASDTCLPGPFYRAVKIYIPGKRYSAKSAASIDKIIEKEFVSLKKLFLTDDAQLMATYTCRWEEAIPVFEKGSMGRFTRLVTEIEDTTQPLVFAGDYLVGPCIEWAFVSGKLAAERMDLRLKSN